MNADALALAHAQLERDRADDFRRQGWMVRLYLAFDAVVALVYAWVFLTATYLEPRWFAGVAIATAVIALAGIEIDRRGHRLRAAALSQALPILPAVLYASAFSVDAGFASVLFLGALGVAVTVPEEHGRWRVGLIVALITGIAVMQIGFPRSRAWALLPSADTSALAAGHRTLLVVGLFSLALLLMNRLRESRLLVDASLRIAHAAAETDPLTGLPNRRPASALLEALRDERATFTVALADIDHFKRLNDTYGHDCGDEALRHVAATIAHHTRPGDIVARWGGEEFLLIVQSDAAGAVSVLDRVREAVASASPACQRADHPVTISVGYSEHREGDETDVALKLADAALYRAKKAGRNTVAGAAAETEISAD